MTLLDNIKVYDLEGDRKNDIFLVAAKANETLSGRHTKEKKL